MSLAASARQRADREGHLDLDQQKIYCVLTTWSTSVAGIGCCITHPNLPAGYLHMGKERLTRYRLSGRDTLVGIGAMTHGMVIIGDCGCVEGI
jgi:hypothetical protein